MDFNVFQVGANLAGRRVRRFLLYLRGAARCVDAPRPRRASRPHQVWRVGDQELCHAQQIQGGADVLACSVAAFHPAVATLPEPTDCFRPTKDLLDAFADALADGVGRVAADAHGSSVVTERGLRRDAVFPHPRDKTGCVVAFVGAQRLGPEPAVLQFHHLVDGDLGFRFADRTPHFKQDAQPMAVFHRRMTGEAQPRLLRGATDKTPPHSR